MKIYYSIDKWVGPDFSDYKTIAKELNEKEAIRIVKESGDDSYLLQVYQWIKNKDIYGGYEITGSINGEEFLINPDDITYSIEYGSD
jgi:hypothetical protein